MGEFCLYNHVTGKNLDLETKGNFRQNRRDESPTQAQIQADEVNENVFNLSMTKDFRPFT